LGDFGDLNKEAVSLDGGGGGGGVLGRSREPGTCSFGRLIEGTLAACCALLAAVWLIYSQRVILPTMWGLR
jgi:hypothetical protein